MHVVVAAKGTEHGDVVAEAAELAGAFDDELHVVSVLALEDPSDDIGPGGPDDAATERFEREAANHAAAAAEAAGVPGAVPVGRVGKSVAREVLDDVDDEVRYLVVGGRKRSPVGKAVFGSTSQRILLEATVPVVSVRTE